MQREQNPPCMTHSPVTNLLAGAPATTPTTQCASRCVAHGCLDNECACGLLCACSSLMLQLAHTLVSPALQRVHLPPEQQLSNIPSE